LSEWELKKLKFVNREGADFFFFFRKAEVVLAKLTPQTSAKINEKSRGKVPKKWKKMGYYWQGNI
jgi:hypothetical protein